MPGVKLQVDIPTDGANLRTPMVDGDPGQVIRLVISLRQQQVLYLLIDSILNLESTFNFSASRMGKKYFYGISK